MAKNKTKVREMTKHQCGVAAESYAASVLARAGYDVFVQYGANQPLYDLVAVKNGKSFCISVKGSQDGGWLLAPKKKEHKNGHISIDAWREKHGKGIVFFFVQYLKVGFDELPRCYLAKPGEIAKHLKSQFENKGHGSLKEDLSISRSRTKWKDIKLPEGWRLTKQRIEEVLQ